jgi:uncharacterized cupin superfamily protein
VIEGEVASVSGRGEEALRAGDCAGFAAGVSDGHHIQNRSDREVRYLATLVGADSETALRWFVPVVALLLDPAAVLLLLAATSARR